MPTGSIADVIPFVVPRRFRRGLVVARWYRLPVELAGVPQTAFRAAGHLTNHTVEGRDVFYCLGRFFSVYRNLQTLYKNSRVRHLSAMCVSGFECAGYSGL